MACSSSYMSISTKTGKQRICEFNKNDNMVIIKCSVKWLHDKLSQKLIHVKNSTFNQDVVKMTGFFAKQFKNWKKYIKCYRLY